MTHTWSTRVEWDEAKNLANQRKHRVSFDEARELFISGTDYLEMFDERHSHDEDRKLYFAHVERT